MDPSSQIDSTMGKEHHAQIFSTIWGYGGWLDIYIYNAKFIMLNQTVIIFNSVDEICKHAASSALELKTQ